MPTKTKPFAQTVWETLAAINVNEHTERKGTLTYLSWSWAWATLMNHYPESTAEFAEPKFYDDRSCEAWCFLTVRQGANELTRGMFLPVMDNRSNAAIDPNSRQISDCRQRCLVKCMALFGLGHYIYSGEDLPTVDDGPKALTPAQVKRLTDLLEESGADKDRFLAWAEADCMANVPPRKWKPALDKLSAMIDRNGAKSE